MNSAVSTRGSAGTIQAGAALLQRSLDDILFWRPDEPVAAVTGAVFLRAAERVASALPSARFYLNFCRTPCGAAIAVAAAMMRGSPCILVTEHAEASIATLLQRFPGAHPVMESADEHCARFPHRTIADPVAADAEGAMPDNPKLPLDQTAIIGMTSGSTGLPTMHAKSWGVLERRNRAATEVFGLGNDGTGLQWPVVASVSPTHMYGMETAVLLPLHAATTTWCATSVFPGDAAANLARAAVIAMPGRVASAPVFITTPLHLGALVETGARLPPLHAVISATAPLDAVLAARAEALWRAPVFEIYGATEVGSIASRRTTRGDAWTLYPGISLETGQGVTEVVAEGASRTALSDILEILPDGRFRLLARASDIIKRGGRRASLAGLAAQLAGLEGVQDAAFLMLDPLRGGRGSTLRPVAFAVAPGQDQERLLAALRDRIEPAFLPRRIILLERLPRNAMGKLPREALVELWEAHGGVP